MESRYLIYDPNKVADLPIYGLNLRHITSSRSISALPLNTYYLIFMIISERTNSVIFLQNLPQSVLNKVIVFASELKDEEYDLLTSIGIMSIISVSDTNKSTWKLIRNIIQIHTQRVTSITFDEIQNFVQIGRYRVKLTNSEISLMKALDLQNPKTISEINRCIEESSKNEISIPSTRMALTRLKNKIYEQTGIQVISNQYGRGYFIREVDPSLFSK